MHAIAAARRITLSDRRLIDTNAEGVKTERLLGDEDEFVADLREEFGVKSPLLKTPEALALHAT